MTDTWRCPTCKAWIQLPVRNTGKAREKHIRTEHPETFKRQQAYKAELLGAEPKTAAVPALPAVDKTELEARLHSLKEEYATVSGVRKAQVANQIKSLERKLQ